MTVFGCERTDPHNNQGHCTQRWDSIASHKNRNRDEHPAKNLTSPNRLYISIESIPQEKGRFTTGKRTIPYWQESPLTAILLQLIQQVAPSLVGFIVMPRCVPDRSQDLTPLSDSEVAAIDEQVHNIAVPRNLQFGNVTGGDFSESVSQGALLKQRSGP